KGFIEKEYDLLISVDCGITALEEVEYARSKGLDVIITDHHQPSENIPDANAVIDPHREDDGFPFKSLAGVGVAFKLCQALEYNDSNQYISEILVNLLDIVALGTVADIVTMTGENRTLVKKGLEIINKTNNLGLGILIKKVGLDDKEITTGRIGYIIAPHLNAAGRVSDPESCIELLITEDSVRAEEIASNLREINKERQDLEQRILDQAREMVEKEIDLEKEKAIILASDEWHHGVIGIVASRLVDEYYRPTILIAIDNGIGKGSCRSISGLNIHDVLSKCSGYLEGYGGHKMAAGLSIDPDNISDFRVCMNDFLNSVLTKEDLIPILSTDALLEETDINMDLYEQLSLLEPFGIGNPRPRFVLCRTNVAKAYPVGKNNKHLKFSLSSGLEGIGFGFGDKAGEFCNDLNIACHLDLNEWQGNVKLQLCLEDFNISQHAAHFPIYFESDNFCIADKRGCCNISEYIEQLLGPDRKIAIYINDFNIYNRLAISIKGKNILLAREIEDLNKFKNLDEGVIFFTSSMVRKAKDLEEINIDNLIFASLPFSLAEMKDAISMFHTGDNKNTVIHKNREMHKNPVIHLLYSERELTVNRDIIKNTLPTDNYLRKLYLYLRALSRDGVMDKAILFEDLQEVINSTGRIETNSGRLRRSLQIFDELGLVDYKKSSIILLPGPGEKLDLSNSISYNSTIDIINRFNSFIGLALSGDLFFLIEEINKLYKEED
ncbi:MAG: single-stranded-DNA-specific exonuclease RecJ, partial [Halanaerobiales bacterium]